MNSITSYSYSDTFKNFDNDRKKKYTCCSKTICSLLYSPLLLGSEIYKRFPNFESFSQLWSGPVLTKEIYCEEIFKEPDYSLKWDELIKIQSSGYSLRHVSTNERGYKEEKEGFYGDAVCLSKGVGGIIYQLFKEKRIILKNQDLELWSLMDDPHSINSLFSGIIEDLTEDDKILIVKEFELAIWKFLNYSIFEVDNRLENTKLTIEFINQRIKNLSNTSTFLVIDEGESSLLQYDLNMYYHLGKGGKRQVPAIHVKNVITVNGETILNLVENSKNTNLLDLLHLIDKAAITSIHQQVLGSL